MPDVAFRVPLPTGFLDVSFDRDGRRIAAMTVQYSVIDDDESLEVVRYDTSHGYLHKHTWSGTRETIVDLESSAHPQGDYAEALTAAINDLKANWAKYLERRLEKAT